MPESLRAMAVRYAELAPQAVPGALALGAALLLAALVLRRAGITLTPWTVRLWAVLLCLAALAVGLDRAWSRMWLADDAFISFRYARNLIDGHGLVFNVGEKVEGYTNFLWTVILSALMKLSVRAEHAAIALGLAFYAGAVLSTAQVRAAVLSKEAGIVLPGSHLLLAVQGLFTTYATSGLETMMCTCLVVAAAALRYRMTGPRGLLLASTCLTLAVLGRPDHVLFYAALGIELMVSHAAESLAARPGPGLFAVLAGFVRGEGRRNLLCYLAPMVLLYGPYFAWRYAYYGFLLPNTFYVKSGGGAYYGQGIVYVLSFVLASHFWLLVPFAALGAVRGVREARSRGFVVFAGTSVVLYGGYVLRVGGDFMYGRFLVPLVPLALLLAELGARTGAAGLPAVGWRTRTLAASALTFLAFAAVPFDTVLQRPGEIRWSIADEPSFYPVAGWAHPEPQSRFTIVGQDLGRLIRGRGVEPRLGLGSIGIAGFYSGLPVLDFMGLTDVQVAHQTVAQRSRPGHEKEASDEYVLSRPVHFAVTKREFHPSDYRDLTRIKVGRSELSIVVYDREIMRRLKGAPEISFVDFEEYLDRYIADLGHRGRPAVARDYRFFRRYYFEHNDDHERERALRSFLMATKRPPAQDPRGPGVVGGRGFAS